MRVSEEEAGRSAQGQGCAVYEISHRSCAESPSKWTSQPYPSDLLGAIERHLSSGKPHIPILRLNLTSLTLHNGKGFATGCIVMVRFTIFYVCLRDNQQEGLTMTFLQEWQHFKNIEWNPYWFENVGKIQLWPRDGYDMEKLEDRVIFNDLSVQALRLLAAADQIS